MESNEPLLAAAGFLAAVVVTLVDGRNAVTYASLATALGLAPSVASFYGADAALVLVGAAVAASLLAPLTRAVSRRLSWMAGVDPNVPVVAAGDGLFGPRSVRRHHGCPGAARGLVGELQRPHRLGLDGEWRPVPVRTPVGLRRDATAHGPDDR